MALTPDTPNESFLREVDENLRRDQMQDFMQRYGKWLIAAVVLFLAAVAGWLYWQDRQKQQVAAQSEELLAAYNDAGGNNEAGAKRRLEALNDADNGVVRALALLSEAALALDANDRPAALAKYRAIANGDVPEPYREIGTIRSTALEFDTLKPEEVIARLQPMTKPGEPWFASAGEMTAMAYLKQGQKQQAARLFAAIAADQAAPATMRSRAAQIAGTLGIDASASLPDSIQQE